MAKSNSVVLLINNSLDISLVLLDSLFPTGRDRPTFQDKGTDVSSLSRENGTTGQAQNLAMGRDGPGQSVKIWDGTRDGTITTFWSKSRTGRGMRRDNHYFFPIISCFGRFFPVIEHPILCLNISFLFYNVFFLFLVFFWESDFVPGRPGTEEFVPGHLLLPLSWDKGTPVQVNFFVPGKRDNGTSCPGLSPDVPSLGNAMLD